ncbi:hypothetical protein BDV39DRAFT_167940 [Aspergillus sergii]|uniref:Uncharacterized protein n=1 Tax=Aspergillus sergii TaxID=1034303 RepID=A0A5N6XFE5_9EURO|nr:hypothetical protein BDV39DRAFT_167940 [Aspergillus sergii]
MASHKKNENHLLDKDWPRCECDSSHSTIASVHASEFRSTGGTGELSPPPLTPQQPSQNHRRPDSMLDVHFSRPHGEPYCLIPLYLVLFFNNLGFSLTRKSPGSEIGLVG